MPSNNIYAEPFKIITLLFIFKFIYVMVICHLKATYTSLPRIYYTGVCTLRFVLKTTSFILADNFDASRTPRLVANCQALRINTE